VPIPARSLNQGRLGLISPLTMPATATRSACVAVGSTIDWLIGCPRVIWLGVTSQW
jgi:hypothetical protein